MSENTRKKSPYNEQQQANRREALNLATRESAVRSFADDKTVVDIAAEMLTFIEGQPDSQPGRTSWTHDPDDSAGGTGYDAVNWAAQHAAEIDAYADAEAKRLEWTGAPGEIGNWVEGIRDAARLLRGETTMKNRERILRLPEDKPNTEPPAGGTASATHLNIHVHTPTDAETAAREAAKWVSVAERKNRT